MPSKEYKYQINPFTGRFELTPTKPGYNFLQVDSPSSGATFGTTTTAITGSTARVSGDDLVGDDQKPTITISNNFNTSIQTLDLDDMSVSGATVTFSSQLNLVDSNVVPVDYTVKSDNKSNVSRVVLSGITRDTNAAYLEDDTIIMPTASFDGTLHTQTKGTSNPQDKFDTNAGSGIRDGKITITTDKAADEVLVRVNNEAIS